jgi:hypothetical protein
MSRRLLLDRVRRQEAEIQARTQAKVIVELGSDDIWSVLKTHQDLLEHLNQTIGNLQDKIKELEENGQPGRKNKTLPK